jgi:hypothetical protein
VESDLFCLDLSILDLHLVAAENNRNVLTNAG